jgi:hypothetical protein
MNTKTQHSVKAKIHVTWRDNHKYFNGKLPTRRWGFCEIARTVIIEPDPHDVYDSGNYGYILVGGKKVCVVNGCGSEILFEIR